MDRKTVRSAMARAATAALLGLMVSSCLISVPGLKKGPVELGALPDKPERTPFYEHGGWTIARASMHNHTVFSDGSRSPEDLLELARSQGMAILAYNDHREGHICIGERVCIDSGGVESHGYDVYYEKLREMREAARGQGMIALKGIEVSSPWFWNSGKSPNLVLEGQYNHFTVYGVEDTQIFKDMPARRSLDNLKPEKDLGSAPFQEFVSYLDERGALVCAVHVDLGQDDWLGPVHVVTPPPVHNLLLDDLTTFAALPEGFSEQAGGPGGLWDTVLAEYLAGMRDRPLFAMGDADYHGPKRSLAYATTLFYMREFTEEEIYNCMREGRMVALQGETFQDSYVAKWSVTGGGEPQNPVMLGQEVTLDAAPVVTFALDHDTSDTSVRLIRNGVVLFERPGTSFTYIDDEQGRKREPAYYRVELVGPYLEPEPDTQPDTQPQSELLVNPIFARFK